MLKTSKICAVVLLFAASQAFAEQAACEKYATVNDLKAEMKKPEYARSSELTQAMHQLHKRNKQHSHEQEYLIQRYHRLTEELNALARTLKQAKAKKASKEEVERARADWNLKNSEILSLKKAYQKEVGTSDIASDAAPILEALDKLQSKKSK